MKRIIIFLLTLVFFLVPFVLAVECEDVMRKNVPCTVITPANLSCSTYNMYDDSGTLIEGPITMPELYSGTGIYSFEFNQSTEKGYVIHLCDGSLATILVGKGNIVEKLEDDHDPGSWGGTAGHSPFEDNNRLSKLDRALNFASGASDILFWGGIVLVIVLGWLGFNRLFHEKN